MKPPVFVTRKLPDAVEARLEANYEAVLNPADKLYAPGEIIEAAQNADALLVCLTEKIDAEVIDQLPERIKAIVSYSVGYDHIDINAARARGIVVTNTPDVLTDATAEIAMLLMLGAARGAHGGEAKVRGGTWGIWTPTADLGISVTGKRLGILGMGRIGQAMAERARAFGMEIHYTKRNRLDPADEKGAIYHDSLESFLPNCDFMSIHAASNDETKGILNESAISQMPEGAVVVNTSRGDLVNDDALISALLSGRIAAAGLDVFNGEPNLDPRYREIENAFLLPHLGSATVETRDAMGFRALDNLDAHFQGETPLDAVNLPL